jgi:Domain of unknown function (DUF4124)
MKRVIALRSAAAVALLAVLAWWPAAAQTLYKLIDKNGKVTYSQEPPKDFDGKVIRIEVNPNANTATLPKFQPPAGKPHAAGGGAEVRALRERVAQRKAALEEAQNNPAEEDVQWVGNAGGGTRRVPTESYRRRLTELERSLKEAEDELHAAEKNAR